MNVNSRTCALALGGFFAAGAAFAHHALPAEYDLNRSVIVSGKVTRIEWTNPHARFYADVRDRDGKTANWEFELGSPNGLMRRGWTSRSLKPGDVVTVNGHLARDGSHLVSTTAVHLADGREVFAGTSADSAVVEHPTK